MPGVDSVGVDSAGSRFATGSRFGSGSRFVGRGSRFALGVDSVTLGSGSRFANGSRFGNFR